MGPFGILVEFVIKPEAFADFEKLIVANAAASMANEPGCDRFDVLKMTDKPATIVLYEIYKDRAAFDEHCRSEHFLSFAQVSKDMVAGKSITELELIATPGK